MGCAVDAAAFVPTNALDLSRWNPDFVSLSFYKMFGYPTGVGCLLARKQALVKLIRPWFAGGTISITSVQGEGWHYLLEDEAGFEEGDVKSFAVVCDHRLKIHVFEKLAQFLDHPLFFAQFS